MTQNAQITVINYLIYVHFIKFNFYASKDTIKKVKTTYRMGKKYLQMMSDKELISRIKNYNLT